MSAFFRKIGLILVILLSPLTLFPQDHQPVLKFVTIDYPPLMGNDDSFLHEVITEVLALSDMKMEYEIVPMARIPYALDRDGTDGVLGSPKWFHRNESPKEMIFCPISIAGMFFYYLKDRFPSGVDYDRLEQLKAYRIGYITGGSLIPLFEKVGLKPELNPLIDQNVRKLFSGRIDLFAATENGGWGAIKREYPGEIHRFDHTRTSIADIYGGLILNSDRQDLKRIFDKGMKEILANGTYRRLYKKYHDGRDVPDYVYSFIRITD